MNPMMCAVVCTIVKQCCVRNMAHSVRRRPTLCVGGGCLEAGVLTTTTPYNARRLRQTLAYEMILNNNMLVSSVNATLHKETPIMLTVSFVTSSVLSCVMASTCRRVY